MNNPYARKRHEDLRVIVLEVLLSTKQSVEILTPRSNSLHVNIIYLTYFYLNIFLFELPVHTNYKSV